MSVRMGSLVGLRWVMRGAGRYSYRVVTEAVRAGDSWWVMVLPSWGDEPQVRRMPYLLANYDLVAESGKSLWVFTIENVTLGWPPVVVEGTDERDALGEGFAMIERAPAGAPSFRPMPLADARFRVRPLHDELRAMYP